MTVETRPGGKRGKSNEPVSDLLMLGRPTVVGCVRLSGSGRSAEPRRRSRWPVRPVGNRARRRRRLVPRLHIDHQAQASSMAINSIDTNRFSRSSCRSSVTDMTAHTTQAPATLLDRATTVSGAAPAIEPGTGAHSNSLRESGGRGGAGVPGALSDPGAGPCLWLAVLGGQSRLHGLDGGRRSPGPTGIRHPVLDQCSGLGPRGADRVATRPRDPSVNAGSDSTGTATSPAARSADARHGGDPRRLLHDVPADVLDAPARHGRRRPRSRDIRCSARPERDRDRRRPTDCGTAARRPRHGLGSGGVDAAGRHRRRTWRRRAERRRPCRVDPRVDPRPHRRLRHVRRAFADLAPADLRGRYMGVASATWSLGAPCWGRCSAPHCSTTPGEPRCGRHAWRPGSRCSPRSRLSSRPCAAEPPPRRKTSVPPMHSERIVQGQRTRHPPRPRA